MIADYETKAAEILSKLMEKLAESGDAILRAFDRLIYLENSGILSELVDISGALLAMKKMPEEFIDDEMEKIATKNLEILLTLVLSVDDEMIERVEKIVEAFKNTREFEPVGIAGALKHLRDPDVQHALGFLLAFAKNLGRRIR